MKLRIPLFAFCCALAIPAGAHQTHQMKHAVLIPPIEYVAAPVVTSTTTSTVPPRTTDTDRANRGTVRTPASTTTTTVKKQTTTTTTKVTQPAVQAASTGGLPAGLLCIRHHESGDNYAEDTHNGYYGAYQYSLSTWNNYKGYRTANLAPASVQDERALSDYNAGPVSRHSHWPQTSRMCGV